MKRWISVVALLLLLTAAWLFSSWRGYLATPVVEESDTLIVRIARGESSLEVYRNLAREGHVTSRWQWPLLLAADRTACIQAGVHTLRGPLTPRDLLAELCDGARNGDQQVTIPEGWTRWRIADHLAEANVVRRERFVELTDYPVELDNIGIAARSAEGLLFPDTYDFASDAPESDIVQTMFSRFEQVWIQVLRANPGALGEITSAMDLSLYEIVIIASIVEREAAVAHERPRIAQVIYNRLREGMRLQMDPTCVYGEDRYLDRPSPDNCRHQPNEWSTYAHQGLPPTPIANPGRASLAAALAPSGEEGLLYFAAKRDGSGEHAFATTFADHQANVERYLR